jgi:hypothetical protein
MTNMVYINITIQKITLKTSVLNRLTERWKISVRTFKKTQNCMLSTRNPL